MFKFKIIAKNKTSHKNLIKILEKLDGIEDPVYSFLSNKIANYKRLDDNLIENIINFSEYFINEDYKKVLKDNKCSTLEDFYEKLINGDNKDREIKKLELIEPHVYLKTLPKELDNYCNNRISSITNKLFSFIDIFSTLGLTLDNNIDGEYVKELNGIFSLITGQESKLITRRIEQDTKDLINKDYGVNFFLNNEKNKYNDLNDALTKLEKHVNTFIVKGFNRLIEKIGVKKGRFLVVNEEMVKRLEDSGYNITPILKKEIIKDYAYLMDYSINSIEEITKKQRLLKNIIKKRVKELGEKSIFSELEKILFNSTNISNNSGVLPIKSMFYNYEIKFLENVINNISFIDKYLAETKLSNDLINRLNIINNYEELSLKDIKELLKNNRELLKDNKELFQSLFKSYVLTKYDYNNPKIQDNVNKISNLVKNFNDFKIFRKEIYDLGVEINRLEPYLARVFSSDNFLKKGIDNFINKINEWYFINKGTIYSKGEDYRKRINNQKQKVIDLLNKFKFKDYNSEFIEGIKIFPIKEEKKIVKKNNIKSKIQRPSINIPAPKLPPFN